VEGWLDRSPDARFVVELPLREIYMPEVKEFWSLMVEKDFLLVHEGEEIGRHDWGGEVEGQEVKCWWGIWRWNDDVMKPE